MERKVLGGLFCGAPEEREVDRVARHGLVSVRVCAEQGQRATGSVEALVDVQCIWVGGVARDSDGDLTQGQRGAESTSVGIVSG